MKKNYWEYNKFELFFWKWKDSIKFRYRMLINNCLKDSLYYRLNHLFWAIFYPLAIIKEKSWRLFWRGVYKINNAFGYYKCKFFTGFPQRLSPDKELIEAASVFCDRESILNNFMQESLTSKGPTTILFYT
jgi:hypothetical protein